MFFVLKEKEVADSWGEVAFLRQRINHNPSFLSIYLRNFSQAVSPLGEEERVDHPT